MARRLAPSLIAPQICSQMTCTRSTTVLSTEVYRATSEEYHALSRARSSFLRRGIANTDNKMGHLHTPGAEQLRDACQSTESIDVLHEGTLLCLRQKK
jgi:hypothetical protein